MALQFIRGRSGAGKSTYIMENIAASLKDNPQKKIILLLPEQATFCYQYELINQYGLNGILSLQILSFQRLARTVLQETGGLARQEVDELGQQMILRKLILQHEKELPFLYSSAHQQGYLEKIGTTFADFAQYEITAEKIEELIKAETTPQTLCFVKLKELGFLYHVYQEYLNQGYTDQNRKLDLLAKKLASHNVFTDTEIWVDEFHNFTAQEYHILAQLMLQTPLMRVALVNDKAVIDLGEKQTFFTTEKTKQRLQEIAQQQHITVLDDIILSVNQRQKKHNDLLHLEQNFAKVQTVKMMGEISNLQIIQAQNRQSEVDFVARTIRKLCREEGYRYKEIGIFTSDFADYELLLQTTFIDYNIPYFIDQKLPMYQHPLTELVLKVLEIVQGDWSYPTMFSYLKTGILPYPLAELDRLENYVLQYGIQGKVWYRDEAWSFGEEEARGLEDLRQTIVQPILVLRERLQQAKSIDQMITAIYLYLENIGLENRLKVLCQQAIEENMLEKAQTHQQIWDKLILIFDQMSEILGETSLTVADFAALLNTAFSSLDLGLIPSSLDQIMIGSLSHSRTRNLKAAFIIGVNEGIFPAYQQNNGLFSELEHEVLQQYGFDFAQSTTEKISDELLVNYLSCTKASEQLYYCYALSDNEGAGMRPSSVIARLHKLFPDLQEQFVQWPPEKNLNNESKLLSYIEESQKVLGLLGSHLPEQNDEDAALWTAVYQWYQTHPQREFQMVQKSLQHQYNFTKHKLTTAGELYGNPLRLSVSSIEKYQQCPYGHFLNYGLRLKERQIYQVASIDIGSFYHLVMENFTKRCLEENLTWRDLTKAQVSKMIEQLVEELAPQLQNEILHSSGRYRYIKHTLQKTAERSAHILWEHGQHGMFKPVAIESTFGAGTDCDYPGLDIRLQDGSMLQLQGRIDRIEEATQGKNHYLRVIDFKTGSKGLRLEEIYYGLKIQLLTYLHIVLKAWQEKLPTDETAIPAGVLYYFFRNGLQATEEVLEEKEAFNLYLKNMLPQGVLTADIPALLLADDELSVDGKSKYIPVSFLKASLKYLEQPQLVNEVEDIMSLFTKTGQNVVTFEQLALLTEHIETIITDTGNAILEGKIGIEPCQLKNFTGCSYCKYQAICQLDTSENANAYYRRLAPLKRENIWALLEKRGSRDDNTMDN